MRLSATQHHVWQMAKLYREVGFSVIPCRADKRPSGQWQEYTVRPATNRKIDRWFNELQAPSIGLVGGRVSDNVVFIDLDGIPAIRLFASNFPQLCESTKSILTGSQVGIHLYVRVDEIPNNINVRVPDVGGFEIRGNGQYVIAPPSPHPSGYQYTVHNNYPIAHLPNINDVYQWMQSLRENQRKDASHTITADNRVTVDAGNKSAYMTKVVSEEVHKVATARKGERNNQLYRSALKLASYSAGGYCDWIEVSYSLLCASSLPSGEAEKTIASAYSIGSNNPKAIR